MKTNNLILLSGFLLFTIVIITGLVLLFRFDHHRGGVFLFLNKHVWSVLHNWCSVGCMVPVSTHLVLKRKWISRNILSGKAKITDRSLILRRRNDIWLFVLFILCALTGLVPWILDVRCHACHVLHDKFGIVLIVIIAFHLFRHRYPSYRFFRA